jgi:hypothetical protein
MAKKNFRNDFQGDACSIRTCKKNNFDYIRDVHASAFILEFKYRGGSMAQNEEFIADPIAFLGNNIIINIKPECHIFGKLTGISDQMLSVGRDVYGLIEDVAILGYSISYDLHKSKDHEYLLRPCFPPVLPPPMKKKIVAVQGKIPAWPKVVIEGNYFPYKAGNVKQLSDMGQAVVDTKSPPEFSFTGAMNGCAFVVTDASPHVTHKYKLYHYQSPNSNPMYGPPPRGIKSFPGIMRCYVSADDYSPSWWEQRYTGNSLFATFIFMWRRLSTGEVRVIAQCFAFGAKDYKINLKSKLVQSWQVQDNSEAQAIPRYTALDHVIHVDPRNV